MDQSTASMLGAIDKRIAKLQQIRALIVEEFGQPANGAAPGPSKRAQNGGRKSQMYEWLKQNGPATRTEIIEGTGMPTGTVGGYLSSEKDLFENREGKWCAR